jgi:protein TonB
VSTLAWSTAPAAPDTGALLARLRAKFGPLAMVLALHVLFFYGVYSGLLNRAVKAALPDAVYVTFVAPPPAAPKQVAPPSAKLAPPVLPPMVTPPPQVQIALSEPTITTAPPVPAPAEKAAAPSAVASTAAPAVAPVPKTVSDVAYIQPPQPVYPAQSKRMGEQGKVVLRVLVNEKGLADQVVVQSSSGFSRLDEAGRQAAQRALFKPHIEDGRAVPVFVIVPLNFQLAS